MSNNITVYEKINDMPGIQHLGKAIANSGLFGCGNPEQGVVFALQCMAENRPPLEMAKRYHIVSGKLTKRADAMLAEFIADGGKFIFADLKDPKSQRAVVTYGDYVDYKVEYTIEDATLAGLINGNNPNWKSRPAAMMRARLISETLRAIAPGIVVGVYDPEEVTAAVDEQAAEIERHVEASITMHDKKPKKAAAKVTKMKEAVTLESLIKGHEAEVNAFYTAKGEINEELGETWRDLDEAKQDRMFNHWDKFCVAAKIGGAK